MNEILEPAFSESIKTSWHSPARVHLLIGALIMVTTAWVVRLYPISLGNWMTTAEVSTVPPGNTPDSAGGPLTPIAKAVIKSSVYDAVVAAGLDPSLAVRLNAIFGGKIDFRRDIRSGDWFAAVYAPVAATTLPPKILAAEISVRGHIYRAFLLPGSIDRYFTESGKSLQQGILRAPVNYSHISSIFSYHRLDPVLGIVRPHYGVDYAAPTGTPVKAAADGYIKFRGIDAGYGNLVVIRSFGRYETYYAHMKGFASSLHVGSRVQQGRVIGYVGESGEATGPHLHYGIKVDGQWRDPLSVPLPDAKPIPKVAWPQFRELVAEMLGKLQAAGPASGGTTPPANAMAASHTNKPISTADAVGLAH